MKTIILCGGIGYRLKEETEFKPKPMVLIGGKPILWHIMKIYSHFGCNEFIIALGYKGDYIKNYFLNQKYLTDNFTLHTQTGLTKIHKNKKNNKDDFKITFVDTGQDTLPGERILRVKDLIPKTDDDFMVTYGDGVSDVNIKELIKFHKKQGTIGTITGVHPRSRYGLLEINKNSIAQKFIEKPVLNEWTNGGFMIFKREFFKYLRKGEFEHPSLKRLIRKGQLSVYIHNGFWHSMDTYPDVDNLNKLWIEDPKWKVWR
ncbi:MAG: sugar phosphate nucleotidyltransferase [Candidatus Daviesbacteria bacterium]|nr:sugar phosphate nucleotidyltransferase [Candidatus Daviesbacteria bacterium]